jgi:flavin-dependent dehydrogenase
MLDKKLERDFIEQHTGYLGVKYHVTVDYPHDEIGLDNFQGGYCGIVKIEDDKFNLCYLYRRKRSDNFKSIRELEETILFRNSYLRKIFQRSTFASATPEVINEISFAQKTCVEDHIFLCGDSAGLITPLCGNGMVMAVHGATILVSTLKKYASPGRKISSLNRQKLEKEYKHKWLTAFSSRLFWGRNLQRISGNEFVTSASLRVLHALPFLERWVIRQTHGNVVKMDL